MKENIKYLPSGDSALVMELGNEIKKEINSEIRRIVAALKENKILGILDILPTYRSILINYDPMVHTFGEMVELLKKLDIEEQEGKEETLRLIEIPTLYGGEYGPDMAFVAEHAGLTEEEVVNIHTGRDYLVYMMGFSPGFTYLGGMDERIATPRLKTPRLKIPAGSVGIAAKQTGMYPSESPGGWQLIGRTPLKLYDEKRTPPVFIQAGDYIRYVAVDEKTFETIAQEVQKGSFQIHIQEVKRGELHE